MDEPRRAALIADPDEYFRLAVEAILTKHLGFSTVYHAKTLDEAFDLLINQPHTCLSVFELNLPGVKSASSLTGVRDCFPGVLVTVVSTSVRRYDILMALDAGVHGYVPKNETPAELTLALKMIVAGRIYVPPFIVSTAALATEGPVLDGTHPKPSASDTLTPRQREVLNLLLKGKSNKEIARTLSLGEGTVKIHMAGLFRALGVNTRAAAAAMGTQLFSVRG